MNSSHRMVEYVSREELPVHDMTRVWYFQLLRNNRHTCSTFVQVQLKLPCRGSGRATKISNDWKTATYIANSWNQLAYLTEVPHNWKIFIEYNHNPPKKKKNLLQGTIWIVQKHNYFTTVVNGKHETQTRISSRCKWLVFIKILTQHQTACCLYADM